MEYEGTENKKLEEYVTKVMIEMGVPAHLKGYQYLRSSIMMAEEDMEVVGSVTKLLYPEIAKRYKTTEQKVERHQALAVISLCRIADKISLDLRNESMNMDDI